MTTAATARRPATKPARVGAAAPTAPAEQHSDLRAAAGALAAAVAVHIRAAIPEGTSIAKRVLQLALEVVTTIENDRTDPAMQPYWLSDDFTDLNALLVAASWAPGSVKDGPWESLGAACNLLFSSGLVEQPVDRPRVNPTDLRRDEYTDWRAKTADLIEGVTSAIRDVEDLDPTAAWAETSILLEHAQRCVKGIKRMLKDPRECRDNTRWQTFELMALLRGAKALEGTPNPIRTLLGNIIATVDAASNDGPGLFLDGPGEDDPGHNRPEGQAVAEAPAVAAPEPSTITRATSLPEGGEVAMHLVRMCTYEIEALSSRIIKDADSGMVFGAFTDLHTGLLQRAAGVRIFELNSLVMSYLSEDDVTLGDADNTINHDRSRELLNDLIAKNGGQS